jgi:pilus assembly protein CpaB
MGRRVLAVFAAVVVALLGVGAVLVYAQGADSRALAGERPQTVFVALKLVPSGTTAADAMAQGLMVATQVAAKGVPLGALTKVDDVSGKLVALSDIAPGEFIVSSRFGTTPLAQAAIQVPDKQIAIAVSLSDTARVGSFVTPGSHIVIYDTYAAPAGGAASAAAGGKQTQVLLDDVLVIAVGSTTLTPPAGGQAPAPATGSLVTVALPPDLAAKLVHSIQSGAMLYAGLPGTGTQPNLGQIVTDSTLFKK